MEPLSLLVYSLAMAVGAGAGDGIKTTTSSIITDSYAGIKGIIKKKFGSKVSIEEIEKNPHSAAKRLSLLEDLKSVNAQNDLELLIASRKLFELIRQNAPETKVTGINISEVEAGYIKINEIISSGDGISISKTKIQQGIEINNVSSQNPI
jgi:hypothetical protein